jgi:hypothetical protein
MELTKTREAESKLRLEFDHQLAKEREILSVKYDSEVDELRASLEAKVESPNAMINELESLQELDSKQHDNDLNVWRARDRKLHSGLLGLEDALHGTLLPPLPSLCSFKPFPHFLAALSGPSLTLTGPRQLRWRSIGRSERSSLTMTPRPILPLES